MSYAKRPMHSSSPRRIRSDITRKKKSPGPSIHPGGTDTDAKISSVKKWKKADADPVHEEHDFLPMPYSFRVSHPVDEKGGMALSPPVWVLTDHTVAVIWCLFNKRNKHQIGINQMHWALEFLKCIRTKQGGSPRDVRLCIELLEECLITQYACLGQLMKQEEEKKACKNKVCVTCKNKPRKRHTWATKIDEEPKEEPKEELKEEPKEEPKEVPKEGKKADTYESRPSTSQKTEEKEVEEEVEEPEITHECKVEKQKESEKAEQPISVTFNSMVRRGSESSQTSHTSGKDKMGEQRVDEMISSLPPEVREAVARMATQPKSRSELVEFLNEWRSRQAEHIEKELEKLQSVEDYVVTFVPEEPQSGVTIEEVHDTKSTPHHWPGLLRRWSLQSPFPSPFFRRL